MMELLDNVHHDGAAIMVDVVQFATSVMFSRLRLATKSV